MPQAELTDEEVAQLKQIRDAARARVAKQESDAYDLSALEDTELERERKPAATPAAKPAAKPVNQHHAYIVEKARSFGIADHDIENMSEEVLVSQIRSIEQYRAREANQANRQQDALRVEHVRPKPPPPPSKPVEDDVDISEYLGDTKESEWEPEQIALYKRMERKRLKEMNELKEAVAGIKQSSQQTQAQTIDAMMDGFFAAANREKEFGRGDATGLIGTPALRRRNAVFQEMQLLGGINAKNFQMAVETLYGKARAAETPEPAAAKPSAYGNGTPAVPARAKTPAGPRVPTEQDYEEGTVSRPTNRRGAAEMKGDERAVAKITEAMREQGIDVNDDGPDALDGFL
jgi:hypothetical protein